LTLSSRPFYRIAAAGKAGVIVAGRKYVTVPSFNEPGVGQMATLKFLAICVSCAGAVLWLIGSVIVARKIFWGYFPADPPGRWFDLDAELAFPAWYSSMLLAACSFLTAFAASQGGRPATHLWVISVVLIFMSADEAITLHEYLAILLLPGVTFTGFLSFSWVVVGAALALLVGLALLPVLWWVPRPTAIGVAASGFVYLTGALGMEMVAAALFDVDSFFKWLPNIFEEGFEILGVNILLWTILGYLRSTSVPTGVPLSGRPRVAKIDSELVAKDCVVRSHKIGTAGHR
jgi:hypothetical protein